MENAFQVQTKIALLVQSLLVRFADVLRQGCQFTIFKNIWDITPGSEGVLLSEEITCNNISYFLYNDPFKKNNDFNTESRKWLFTCTLKAI